MGNVLPDFSRPYHGGPVNNTGDNRKFEWDGTSWAITMMPRRDCPYSDEEMDEDNGYILGGVFIPETVLEHILSKVQATDILACNMVCRAWKDLLVRKSFWKNLFLHHNLDWDVIPSHVKKSPNAWIVFHAEAKYHVFSKNFISNHSGCHKNQGWRIQASGGQGWKIEKTPIGCSQLPPDPFFYNSQHCFVTSYNWCSREYKVDLWSAGLTPAVMKLSLPFEIECSQMFGARFDCGGLFNWSIRIHDVDFELIREERLSYSIEAGSDWQTATMSLVIKESWASLIEQMRYLSFIIDGKDDRFWAGFYGTKFSRSCVRIRFNSSVDHGAEGDNNQLVVRDENEPGWYPL